MRKVLSYSEKLIAYFNHNYDKSRSFSPHGVVGAISEIMKVANNEMKGFKNLYVVNKKRRSKKEDSRKKRRRSSDEAVKTKFREMYGEGSFEWVLNDGLAHYVYVTKEQKVTVSEGVVRKGVLYVDGRNSRFMGKHPLRNATRPQKFNIPSKVFLDFCYENCYELMKEREIDIDKCIINRGCWHTNKHTLQRQLIPEVENYFTSAPDIKILKRFKNAIRNTIRKLNMDVLPKPDKRGILYTPFNRNTYPGSTYEFYLKKNLKKDCVGEAVQLASIRWDRLESGIIERDELFPSLYTIGARNKRDYSYDNGEVATSRVVHMPEMHVELCSGPWTDEITEHLKEIGKGPVFIGNSLVKYKRLERLTEGTKFQLEGDWKRFDSTLYINIITAAVAILRCYFDLEDELVDRHFIGVYDSVAIKDYYTPGGNVYRAMHGLPSGVKSTNLLGSIINLIALNFCVDTGANRDYSFAVGGDDFIVAYKGDKDYESIKDKFLLRAERIGMKLKFLDVKNHKSDKLEDLPCFYKYVVKENSPYIPTNAMLERVFMPWNKTYETLNDIEKFLIDVTPSLGTPSTHLYLFYKFFAHVRAQILGRDVDVNDIIREHIIIFKRMMNKGVFPKKNEFGNEGTFSSALQELLRYGNLGKKELISDFGAFINEELDGERPRSNLFSAVNSRVDFQNRKFTI